MSTTHHEADDWDADAALDLDYSARIFFAFYLACVLAGVGYQWWTA